MIRSERTVKKTSVHCNMVEIVLYGKYFPRSMEIYDKHFLSTRVIKTVLSFEIIINAMDMVASKSSAVAI